MFPAFPVNDTANLSIPNSVDLGEDPGGDPLPVHPADLRNLRLPEDTYSTSAVELVPDVISLRSEDYVSGINATPVIARMPGDESLGDPAVLNGGYGAVRVLDTPPVAETPIASIVNVAGPVPTLGGGEAVRSSVRDSLLSCPVVRALTTDRRTRERVSMFPISSVMGAAQSPGKEYPVTIFNRANMFYHIDHINTKGAG